MGFNLFTIVLHLYFVTENNHNEEIQVVPGICLCTLELLLHEPEVDYELLYKVPFLSHPCYNLALPKTSIYQVRMYH